MDSLRAFFDATKLPGLLVDAVEMQNGANSVWLGTYQAEPLIVLKYYEGDAHSFEHYASESSMLINNQGNSIMPSLLRNEDSNRMVITRFVPNDPEPQVSFETVASRVSSDIPALQFQVGHWHTYPGVLAWWDEPTEWMSVLSRTLLRLLREEKWFSQSILKLKSAWSPECIIHGDLKISNIRLSSDQVVVIDWEGAALGIGEWDKAGLLQSALMELVNEGPMAKWVQKNLDCIIQELFDANDLCRLSLVARFAQTALEANPSATKLSPRAALALKFSQALSNGNVEAVVKELNNAASSL